MVAHIVPCTGSGLEPSCRGPCKGRHGPLRVALHAASRRQGTGVDTGAVPGGTRGGHREGPRAQATAWLPGGGGTTARSTGMMAGRDSKPAVAGGLARHVPVLGRRIGEFLAVRDQGVYVDATFGAGGYTREILEAANCSVIAIDRDPSAVARGFDLVEAAGGRLVLIEDRFSNLAA